MQKQNRASAQIAAGLAGGDVKVSKPNTKINSKLNFSLPQRVIRVSKRPDEWNIYRTRFLVKAKQLTEPLMLRDALGHEHCGQAGDYLIENSDGVRRIAPRQIFEDIYVAMLPTEDAGLRLRRHVPDASQGRRLAG
jgi:hypothetical protein